MGGSFSPELCSAGGEVESCSLCPVWEEVWALVTAVDVSIKMSVRNLVSLIFMGYSLFVASPDPVRSPELSGIFMKTEKSRAERCERESSEPE
ncbi:MAG: hypothetical protein V3S50_13485, partial [Acidobacteriota bacterium]